ncbi:MAG: RHS repeat-associated core domain-containing protein, partial [Anaerolineae bacterium]|nr:RHS repeat-associated core domain-containing protein [Anaerolineae bacterium]
AVRQDLSFSWDAGGNLKTRTDHTQGGLTETFFYDALNRLSYSQRAGVQNLALGYNANGSIASRLEGGMSYSYQYLDAAHPHAVSEVLHDCGCNCLSDTYAYDANGNQTTRGGAVVGRTISWSSYDLPVLITQDGVSSQFAYGPNRSRWKQVAVYSASTTETTLYLGGVMEKVTRGAVTEWKHYIPAGAGTMALQVRKSAGSPASATYYVTGDHLGSATAVMQADGTLLSQLSFAAFGSRRGSAWQDQLLAAEWTTITATTRRGFTGHEHLDNLSLVHMNGRVYDPQLGRFLSADPVYGGDLAQPQTLNPYSYVANNPLTATDPSGWMDEITVIGVQPKTNWWNDWFEIQSVFYSINDGSFGTVVEHLPTEDEAEEDAINTIVVTATKPNEASERKASSQPQTKPLVDVLPELPSEKQCVMSNSDRYALAGFASTFAGMTIGIAAQVRNDAPILVRGLGAAGALVSAATAINGFRTGNYWDAGVGTLDTAAFVVSVVVPQSVVVTGPYFLARGTMELVMLAGREDLSGGSCVP